MPKIFEIKDKSGRKISLSQERWTHINQEHPEVAPHIEEIKETLENPIQIKSYEFDEEVKYYYKHLKQKPLAGYLLVIVKYLNGEGFIITSYFVRNIK
ncbi:hypothetical protein HY638_02985 [Candidatus Woesearchaeota archaeon]|nr:hypothetical protein [Candidatus Woesearchaeota archaeon]